MNGYWIKGKSEQRSNQSIKIPFNLLIRSQYF